MADKKPLTNQSGVLQEIPNTDTLAIPALKIDIYTMPKIVVSATEPSTPPEGLIWIQIP